MSIATFIVLAALTIAFPEFMLKLFAAMATAAAVIIGLLFIVILA